jgi:hypothetical protein
VDEIGDLERHIDKQRLIQKEHTKREEDDQKHLKAIRTINLGIIDINAIIRIPNDQRSQDDCFILGIYLMEMTPFFRQHEEFKNSEFLTQFAERLVCERYKKG